MVSLQKNQNFNSPLSDIQISLLRLFEQGISETETLEVRKMLMDYFDRGLKQELEEVQKYKNYSDDDYRSMLKDDGFKSK